MTHEIIQIQGVETGVSQSGKSWQKIGIVLKEKEGQYPKTIHMVSMYEPIVKAIQGLKVGQLITPYFSVESKEFNGKWYTSCTIYKFDTEGETTKKVEPIVEAKHSSKVENLPF